MTQQVCRRKNKSKRTSTRIVFLTLLAALVNCLFAPIEAGPELVSAKQHQPAAIKHSSAGGDRADSGRSGVFFEANQGQHDKRVKFSARGSGYRLFVTESAAVYVIPERYAKRPEDLKLAGELPSLETPGSSRAVAVWMNLIGAHRHADAVGIGELAGKHNYFRGSDQSKWQSSVPLYRRAQLINVYEGVDMEWYGNAAGIQYDFNVSPYASTQQIEWRIEGSDKVTVDSDGSLLISTPFGALRQKAPVTYQEADGVRTPIESRFEQRGATRVGFVVGSYDRSKPLTIDPVTDLVFGTFLGGELDETSYAIADGAHTGGPFVTGSTFSLTFPTTSGVYNSKLTGSDDVFVTKLSPEGSELVYSTFIGGGGNDGARGIAVDTSGSAYITGYTSFSETPYPTTVDAPFPDHTGGDSRDAFVTKLNATGSALVYSTFLGGTGRDDARGIAVRSGSAYIVGFTISPDFPTTPGAWDTSSSNSWEIFVSRINAQGSTLTYSTYIGGDGGEEGYGVAVDSAGNALIAGASNGFGYPVTAGAYQTTPGGNFDAVVTKLNATGSALLYSTFVGGNGRDLPQAIAIDSTGSAYITGQTNGGSIAFPTTVGAFDRTYNGGFDNFFTEGDVFVSKLNPTGTGLVYSTFIGGNNADTASGIAVNANGNAFITGTTESFAPAYPTTARAFDITANPGFDVFFTKLTVSGSALIYSTLIGGNSGDVANGIALNSAGDAFLTGITASNGTITFPITDGAFQPASNSVVDSFICKFAATSNVPIVRAPFDFDADGKTDIGIFRPAAGEWWYQRSSDLQVPAFQFGAGTDKITPVDFSGDGKTDVAFWRPSSGEWFVLRSEDNSYFAVPFGTSGDVPTPADYDGDGKGDIAVFRPSNATWYISRSSGGTTIQQFGASSDVPVTADYDGDGRSDIAIFRPGPAQWWIQRSSNEQVLAFQFGSTTDRVLPGDYTGDGKADVAFWRPSTGFWTILRSEDSSFYSAPFGGPSDMAAPGDYDGDGRYDLTVFRPSTATWYVQRTTAGTAIVGFGAAGDIPVASAFVR